VSTMSCRTDRIANNLSVYLVIMQEKLCGGLFHCCNFRGIFV